MNLETSYLGLTLKNPLVHSASPLAKKIDNIKKLFGLQGGTMEAGLSISDERGAHFKFNIKMDESP